MGNDKDNIEMMVPYTLNDDTPNGDTPNDQNPNEDTSNINNESKATIPGTSSNQGRKVIINPTDDEILAAQGLLQLFQEARVFSTSKKPTYPASININSRLLSGAGRSEFPLYPFFMSDIPTTGRIRTGNPSVVGGVDKSQNDGNKGGASLVYPPICSYSTLINIEEVKDAATSILSPSLFPPFLPYSTSAMKEEVNDTASIMKSQKPKESEKKHYLNRNSKKRKADEAYMKKKVEVHQKMELYKDN